MAFTKFQELNENGELWVGSTGVFSLSQNGMHYEAIVVGENPITVELFLVETGSARSVLKGYEGDVFTGGTFRPLSNRNRLIGPTAQPSARYFANVTATPNPALLFTELDFLGVKNQGTSTGAEIPIILKPNTTYVFEFQKLDSGTSDSQIIIGVGGKVVRNNF